MVATSTRTHARDARSEREPGAHARGRVATVYRMVMPEHVCPYGMKTVDLLTRQGFNVDDHWLRTREEQDRFKAEHQVETTPQTFVGGRRVGGYDDVRRQLGLVVRRPGEPSYRPVIVVFVVAALIALATGGASGWSTLRHFAALSMTILALLKLQDVEQFSTMFLGYDLLARRVVRYAYVYPYAELAAGVLMLAEVAPWISVPLAAFVGSIGALSVIYAVYIQKRGLECACVGGSGAVPLGFVSLTENVVMVAMAAWTALRCWA